MTTLPSYSPLRIIITSGLDTEPCVFATSSVKLFGRFIMITSATLSTFTGLANEELSYLSSVVMIWALTSSEAQVLCSWRNLAGMLTPETEWCVVILL